MAKSTETPAADTEALNNQELAVTPVLDLPDLPAPDIIMPPPPPPPRAPTEVPEPVNPFSWSDIKNIVRVPAGFECAVKFDHRDDYVAYLASADDVEPHGRAIYEACASGQWGESFDYHPSDTELMAAAQERIARELRRANPEITKYQDRVDIDVASATDVSLLRAWKTYRVALNRIPDQAGFPHSLTWPVAPDTTAT